MGVVLWDVVDKFPPLHTKTPRQVDKQSHHGPDGDHRQMRVLAFGAAGDESVDPSPRAQVSFGSTGQILWARNHPIVIA